MACHPNKQGIWAIVLGILGVPGNLLSDVSQGAGMAKYVPGGYFGFGGMEDQVRGFHKSGQCKASQVLEPGPESGNYSDHGVSLRSIAGVLEAVRPVSLLV